jgi:signal transduction histidine kinase
VLGDPGMRLLFRLPGGTDDGYVDLAGNPTVRPDVSLIPLLENGSDVAAIVLSKPSTRRTRQARELALLARLPIEVSRLRLELRLALRDMRATQARLTVAGAEERRRLERDLHDGAQQHIVAVGMHLRSIQRRLGVAQPAYIELDQAVEMIEAGISELRTLAHGVRPSGLQDGLAAALRDLVAASPIPVELDVAATDLPEVLATTSYFVVAECIANAYKHAHASLVCVRVADGAQFVTVTIRDDGVGGAVPAFGLTSVRDRVEALGGSLLVDSPVGAGTTIHAELPCAS